MKKTILFAAAVLFSAGMIFITGCKKDDTTGPVITLNGSASENSILNATWTDAGATAEDDEDGPVEVTVSGTVNKDLAGVYTITYTAVDAAGNESSADRTVTVYNEANTMDGTYACSIVSPAWNYTQTITASTTVNKRIHFSKFGDYANNTGIYVNVTGTSLDLPSQTAVNVGNPATTRTFVGTGSTNANGFSLSYTETTASGSANFVENFVKQ